MWGYGQVVLLAVLDFSNNFSLLIHLASLQHMLIYVPLYMVRLWTTPVTTGIKHTKIANGIRLWATPVTTGIKHTEKGKRHSDIEAQLRGRQFYRR
jgi:hypothetical protein